MRTRHWCRSRKKLAARTIELRSTDTQGDSGKPHRPLYDDGCTHPDFGGSSQIQSLKPSLTTGGFDMLLILWLEDSRTNAARKDRDLQHERSCLRRVFTDPASILLTILLVGGTTFFWSQSPIPALEQKVRMTEWNNITLVDYDIAYSTQVGQPIA